MTTTEASIRIGNAAMAATTAAMIRGAKLERRSSTRGAALTRVTLADGYVCTFVGRIGKGEAVRNAVYQQAKGQPGEAAS